MFKKNTIYPFLCIFIVLYRDRIENQFLIQHNQENTVSRGVEEGSSSNYLQDEISEA